MRRSCGTAQGLSQDEEKRQAAAVRLKAVLAAASAPKDGYLRYFCCILLWQYVLCFVCFIFGFVFLDMEDCGSMARDIEAPASA